MKTDKKPMLSMATQAIIWALGIILSGALTAYSDDSVLPLHEPRVRNCWWNEAAEELALAAEAPWSGTWHEYLLAAGIGGTLILAIRNDISGYAWVQNHRTSFQDQWMPPATLLGDAFFEVGVCAALAKLGGPREKIAAGQVIEGQICVAVAALVLKSAFSSPRPDLQTAERRWFTGNLSNQSFPSGHTMSAFCAAAILGRHYQAEWLAYPLAALVAYSRVYNQSHWPSDVIAGAGLGLVLGHAVLHWHDRAGEAPAFQFSSQPSENGGTLWVTWAY